MPMPPWNALGAWEFGTFIGAILFGRGASPNLGSPYGLTTTSICELLRVALNRHDAKVSRIVAIAMRIVAKRNPGLRLVVSFADTNEGHHGGIYQAGNWIYSGITPPKTHFRDKQGKVWHSRQTTTTGMTNQFGSRSKCAKRSDCEKVELEGKHRYLMPLDAEMRARVLPLAKPYPKRPKKPDDPDQGNRGRGSTDPDAPSSAVTA
jgi:hypothetical protein